MKVAKTVGVLSIIAAVIMIVAGGATWFAVSDQLRQERITIGKDSEFMGGAFAGKDVAGPLTAYAQADLIRQHATASAEGTEYEGKTYAELGSLAREAEKAGDETKAQEIQERRDMVMQASFLRASLFTSVVAFGVAALVIGLGVLAALVGFALLGLAKSRPAAATVADPTVAPDARV